MSQSPRRVTHVTFQRYSRRLLDASRDPNHREVARAAAVVATATLLVKVIGIAREILIARHFGVSESLDAYLAALGPISLATALIGSLNAAFIPSFVEVLDRDGAKAADRLLRSVALRGMGALAILTVGMAAAGKPLLGLFVSGFSREKLELTFRLYLIMMPIIVLTGAASLWTAVLNARGRFALGAVAPAVISLTVALVFLLVGSRVDAYVLASATTTGYLVQLMPLGWLMRKLDAPLLPGCGSAPRETAAVMRQFGPMVAGALLLSTSPLVDQAMASRLGPGSLSVIGYGSRLAAQLTSLTALAVATAVLPSFSRLTVSQDWRRVRGTLNSYSVIVFGLMLPATLVLFVFSSTLVRILYQRGAFSPADTIIVSDVQRMFVLQVPFYTTAMLYVRLLSALRRNDVLVWGNVLSVTLNVVLNLVLIQHFGIRGIALSTSIVIAISCSVSAIAVYTLLHYRIRNAEATTVR
jgi:putative peptidoglycan lipid II flippase